MKINTQQDNGVYTLFLEGEVDASSSIVLDKAIQEALDKQQFNLLVNCHQLRYISSAGLGVFLAYFDNISKQKGKLVFSNMKPSIYETFRLLGLSQIFTIENTTDEALKHFTL
ncbi:MAG: STAS domain-containing protein [Chitinophagales bacterium]|nr:STAS domain-containing protein [Bacteroidota bacterium]